MDSPAEAKRSGRERSGVEFLDADFVAVAVDGAKKPVFLN